jgi:hypothetical protein
MHRSIDLPEIIAVPSGCWIWTRAVGRKGYPRWTRRDKDRGRAAHRVIFEEFNGPIPDDMQLDHLCRVVRCVNPGHMEIVVPKENRRRQMVALRRRRAWNAVAPVQETA